MGGKKGTHYYHHHKGEGERGGGRRWERKWKRRGVGGERGRKWNPGNMDREVLFFSIKLRGGEEMDQQAHKQAGRQW